MTQSARTAGEAPAVALATVGGSRGWTITFGVLTLITGILILAWPGATLLVIAVLFGIQLLVAGIFRLVAAFAVDEAGVGGRVLFALLGILSIVVGILCLRAPLQTIAVLTLLLGLIWTVGGVIDIFHAIGGDVPSRGWAIAFGLLSVIAGIIVLVYPISSLVTLATVAGILFIIYGAMAVINGIMSGRSSSSSMSASSAPAAA